MARLTYTITVKGIPHYLITLRFTYVINSKFNKCRHEVYG